jgi:hypothetical protein
MVIGTSAAVVAVRLPDACGAAMERDGIVAKPPYGMGERAWWLLQAVAAVPPGTWSAAAGTAPGELLTAAGRGEWRDILVPAWRAAAVRHADAAWAEALVASPLRRPWTLPGVDSSAGALLDILPADRAEAVALAAVADRDAAEASALLSSIRRQWSPELTRAVLDRIGILSFGGDHALRPLLASLAPRMHPAAVLDAVAVRPQAFTGAWADLLHHRHAMLEALKR